MSRRAAGHATISRTISLAKCGPDGARRDVDGNVWVSSNGNPGGRGLGYSGVTVWTPEGKLIGRIRLPEVCANLSFVGPKRNRLFMAASQSLYAVYVNTQGAAPAEEARLLPPGSLWSQPSSSAGRPSIREGARPVLGHCASATLRSSLGRQPCSAYSQHAAKPDPSHPVGLATCPSIRPHADPLPRSQTL